MSELTEDEQGQLNQIREAGANVIDMTCAILKKGFEDNRIIAAMEDIILKDKERIADLESENKALRLIAGSHSMSELRRNRIMTGWVRGDTLKNEVEE